MSDAVVLGARVKSGWASAVLLAVGDTPRYLARAKLELADAAEPHSSQPYHGAAGGLQTDPSVIARLTSAVYRATIGSLAAAVEGCPSRPQQLVLVVGSTIDPAAITNEHIRAHAHEAQLFRTALARAAQDLKLPCAVVRERDLRAAAPSALGPSAAATVAAMVKDAGRPWRTDEKLAALAAWWTAAAPDRLTTSGGQADPLY